MRNVETAELVGCGSVVPSADRELRGRARALLERYLNLEWPTRAGAVLQPFATAVRRSVGREAEGLLATAGAEVRAVADVMALGAALADVLRGLGAPAAETEWRRIALPALEPASRAARDPGFARLAAALRRARAATGARFVLHGSLASDDWTGYRDADLVVIVPAGAAASARSLEALRRALLPVLRALYRFDPLQHHGLFAVPEAELAAWPEHWLPLDALSRAVDPCGEGFTIMVAPCHDRDAAARELRWLADRLASCGLPADAYGWKAFASLLMLAPASYLSACGRPCAKRDSFAIVAATLPEALWEPIRWATRVRREWSDPTPRVVRWLCGIAPNPRATALLLRGLARPRAAWLGERPEALLGRTAELVRCLESRARGEAVA